MTAPHLTAWAGSSRAHPGVGELVLAEARVEIGVIAQRPGVEKRFER